MTDAKRRVRRIEILLVLVVIGGLMWFSKFPRGEEQAASPAAPTASVVANTRPTLIEGPDPVSFEIFSVPGFKMIEREIICADSLYTVVVFPIGVDYRQTPRSAVYNTATACEKGKKIEITLREEFLKIREGEYYLILADQGVDTWYNPR